MKTNDLMRTITINGIPVGDGHPAYIIAEVGINHGGSAGLAIEMVQAAWEAGAHAVKIQTFVTRAFLHESHPGFQYDIDAELTREEEARIWDFARARGINLFSTPEEFDSLEFIRTQNPALIKIAAMDFNFRPLVAAAAGLGKPIILSSGMSDLEETLRAVRWTREAGNAQAIVLHCVSSYPAPAQSCNLAAIQTLKTALDCPVGFSDHTIGIHVPLAATALGASVIEKHFTLDRHMAGPDHACSMDPADLRALVDQTREIHAALGDGRKRPAAVEEAPRRFKRRGLFAARELAAGAVLRDSDVLFFAPSDEGSTLEDWELMRGGRLKRAVAARERLRRSDLAHD